MHVYDIAMNEHLLYILYHIQTTCRRNFTYETERGGDWATKVKVMGKYTTITRQFYVKLWVRDRLGTLSYGV